MLWCPRYIFKDEMLYFFKSFFFYICIYASPKLGNSNTVTVKRLINLAFFLSDLALSHVAKLGRVQNSNLLRQHGSLLHVLNGNKKRSRGRVHYEDNVQSTSSKLSWMGSCDRPYPLASLQSHYSNYYSDKGLKELGYKILSKFTGYGI